MLFRLKALPLFVWALGKQISFEICGTWMFRLSLISLCPRISFSIHQQRHLKAMKCKYCLEDKSCWKPYITICFVTFVTFRHMELLTFTANMKRKTLFIHFLFNFNLLFDILGYITVFVGPRTLLSSWPVKFIINKI